MDPDPFHDSKSGPFRPFLKVPGTEIPKCLKFNHQSFGNSLSFWVGKKFPKLAVCIAFRLVEAHKFKTCKVNISINGCKQLYPIINRYGVKVSEELWLFPISLGQLNKQKLSEQNHIEVEVICKIFLEQNCLDIIKWIGVNVECSCYPQNSDVTCLPLPCDIPTVNSFDGFSRYEFKPLFINSCDGVKNELDFQYFPPWRRPSIINSNNISIT